MDEKNRAKNSSTVKFNQWWIGQLSIEATISQQKLKNFKFQKLTYEHTFLPYWITYVCHVNVKLTRRHILSGISVQSVA